MALRVVFDTSVLVAAIRSRRGASREWLRLCLVREHDMVISVPLILEYEAVLKRHDHLQASGLRANQIDRLLDGICSVAIHVEIANRWRPFLRDPDDEMLLETAVFGGAGYLLTFNAKDFAGAEKLRVRVKRPGDALDDLLGDPK
jgi:putative PIN family toxin of toxin-antitoxin system